MLCWECVKWTLSKEREEKWVGGWHGLARIVPLKGVKVRACKHVSVSMGVCVWAHLRVSVSLQSLGEWKKKGLRRWPTHWLQKTCRQILSLSFQQHPLSRWKNIKSGKARLWIFTDCYLFHISYQLVRKPLFEWRSLNSVSKELSKELSFKQAER